MRAWIRSSDGSSLVSGQRDSSASSASAKVSARRGWSVVPGWSVMRVPAYGPVLATPLADRPATGVSPRGVGQGRVRGVVARDEGDARTAVAAAPAEVEAGER